MVVGDRNEASITGNVIQLRLRYLVRYRHLFEHMGGELRAEGIRILAVYPVYLFQFQQVINHPCHSAAKEAFQAQLLLQFVKFQYGSFSVAHWFNARSNVSIL